MDTRRVEVRQHGAHSKQISNNLCAGNQHELDKREPGWRSQGYTKGATRRRTRWQTADLHCAGFPPACCLGGSGDIAAKLLRCGNQRQYFSSSFNDGAPTLSLSFLLTDRPNMFGKATNKLATAQAGSFRYNAPMTQVALLGFIIFCSVGMFSAVASLGAGGGQDLLTVDIANSKPVLCLSAALVLTWTYRHLVRLLRHWWYCFRRRSEP